MKKGLILIVILSAFLVGCEKNDNEIVAVMDSTTNPVTTSKTTSMIITESTTTAVIQGTTKPITSNVVSRTDNLYIEIETTKKEKHKYTFVYKNFDECQAKGQEFLPLLKRVHPEIVKSDCMYLKDDNNNRYWGVIFQTCDNPSTICNFYY